MIDIKEKRQEQTSQEDMQAQEILKWKEHSIQLEQELLLQSQKSFNKYQMGMNEVILREILSLNESLAQLQSDISLIGEAVSRTGQKESDVDTEESEGESVDTQTPRSKYDEELEKKQDEIAKLEEQIAKDKEIVKRRGRPSLK